VEDTEAQYMEHLAHLSMPEVGLLMEVVDLGDIMVGLEVDADTGLGNRNVVIL
jgi:hypothetical protein